MIMGQSYFLMNASPKLKTKSICHAGSGATSRQVLSSVRQVSALILCVACQASPDFMLCLSSKSMYEYSTSDSKWHARTMHVAFKYLFPSPARGL